MHKHNENGSVATIRSIETKASSRAQHPGPSGSAVKRNKMKVITKDTVCYSLQLIIHRQNFARMQNRFAIYFDLF